MLIKEPVAGIAMGLIKEQDVMILSDILGLEDHLGDMDFKVCGTKRGVTALQMDIKIGGITPTLMHQALEQAKAGRLHILSCMQKALETPRANMSAFAPRIHHEGKAGQDPRSHWPGRENDPRHPGGLRGKDQHRRQRNCHHRVGGQRLAGAARK